MRGTRHRPLIDNLCLQKLDKSFTSLESVRTTLIPTFAVPVSLIGTFIALLAVGYSANSVSLLAIVHWHSGRRRDRRRRKCRARHGGAPRIVARGSDQAGHARNFRANYRNHTGTALGFCASRIRSGYLGRVVSPIRRHGSGLDVAVGN
jgi:hypothetical protein